MSLRYQKTLKKEIVFSGFGLFTGRESVVRLCPAPCGAGIVFIRTDLPGSPEIPALLEYVKDSSRCTLLSRGEASVQTVEHLLAALRGLEVDNVRVEVSGPEVPIFDGSALTFVNLIDEAGIVSQEEKQEVIRFETSLSWSKGEMHIVAIPADAFKISYTLHYPHSPYLRSQYFTIAITPEAFRKEIAPCRTFTLYEDIAPFIEKGLLKGAGLENGVVIQGDGVLNPEGVRFPDEMVRHKILDLIGDFCLAGLPVVGHIIAIRSGHSANHAFVSEVLHSRSS